MLAANSVYLTQNVQLLKLAFAQLLLLVFVEILTESLVAANLLKTDKNKRLFALNSPLMSMKLYIFMLIFAL